TADALSYQAGARSRGGDLTGALETLAKALQAYHAASNKLGQASVLAEIGLLHRQAGHYPEAARAINSSLIICRDLGDGGGEAEILNEMGTLRLLARDAAGAEPFHRRARYLARQIGSPWDEAHALAGLGRCALTTGRTTDARTSLQYAQEILQIIGAAEAAGISAELGPLTCR